MASKNFLSRKKAQKAQKLQQILLRSLRFFAADLVFLRLHHA
jgi:hypothetical protein